MSDDFFGSDNKPQISTQNTQPWEFAQPYLQKSMKTASSLLNNKSGFKPWSGPVLAPMNGTLQQGLEMTSSLAGQPVEGLGMAHGLFGSMMAGSGSPGVDTLRQFADGNFNEDPRLATALAERERRAMNGAATQFGGGRYGSAAIGQGMGQAMATAGNELMLQSNENNRNRQLQAGGVLGNWGLQAAQMLPALDALKYSGANHMMEVGNFMQDRSQAEKDAEIKAWEAKQQAPWERLAAYNGIVNGMGALGGSRTSVSPGKQMSPFQKAAGIAGILGAFA